MRWSRGEIDTGYSAWPPTLNPKFAIHSMSDQLRQRLFAELDSIRLIDAHSHIEPKTAAHG